MATTATTRPVMIPSAATLIGTVYVVCVLGLIAVHVGAILFTDVDPHANDGPIESMITIAVIGTIALVLAVGLGLLFSGTPQRSKAGAVVMAALSLLTFIIFWSGAPAVFGAAAVWQAGLTKGRTPLTGSGRVAGLVGLFMTLVTVLLMVGGVVLDGLR